MRYRPLFRTTGTHMTARRSVVVQNPDKERCPSIFKAGLFLFRSGSALVGLISLFLWLRAAISDDSPPSMAIRLVDVAKEAGVTVLNIHGGEAKDYIVEVNGNGAAFFDYDNDGHMDILIVNGSTLRNLKKGGDPMVTLYRNMGNGKFTDVTSRSGMHRKGWGMGVCVADYDNDGHQDVYITTYGPNVLYRNNGDGTFTDVTEKAGVGDPRWGTGCAFGDYDRDGYVDLYVANYAFFDEKKSPKAGSNVRCRMRETNAVCGPLMHPAEPDVLYRNNGAGTFTDVTQKAGIVDHDGHGFGVLFSDLDNDGWPDIYIANDESANFFFRNNRDGSFSEIGLQAGVALSGEGKAQGSMGVDAGDYMNNGHFAVFVTNYSNEYNALYRNNEDGTFTDVSLSSGAAPLRKQTYVGWGTGFVDLDNDGRLDLFIANGNIYPQADSSGSGTKYHQPKQVFKNLGNGRFRELTKEIGGGLLIERSSRGVAFGDYDNDGDLDILVINLNGRPTLLRNEGGNRNHWATFKLVGTKSNRDAIGARVTAKIGGGMQAAEVRSGGSYISHNDMRVHFGLGDATRIDALEVRWPGGLIESFKDLTADRFYVITEGRGVGEAKAPPR